jgi:hypothetical protein
MFLKIRRGKGAKFRELESSRTNREEASAHEIAR